jgi:hypothetical protein
MRASKNGLERCAILCRSLEKKEVDIRPTRGVEFMAAVAVALFMATGKNQNLASPRVLQG